MGEGPVQISHGGSQGFKSPHLHPNLAGQSVASVERATLTACSGRAAAASSSHSPARRALRDARRLGPRPPHDHPAWSPQLPTDARSSPASRRSRSATRSTWPLPNHRPTMTTKSKPTCRWPNTTCASPEGQAPTSGRRRAVVHTAGDHADPGHPSRAGCRPRRLAPRPHSRRTQRTPEAGHWTPGHSDGRTGHRSLGQAPRTPDARTGHRTGTRTR
jgi:hypothetical protein